MLRSKSYWNAETKKICRALERAYAFSQEEEAVAYATLENHHLFSKAAEQLEQDGLTITNEKGTIRKHPATEVAKVAWAAFLAGCKFLGICREIEKPRRPGRPGREVG